MMFGLYLSYQPPASSFQQENGAGSWELAAGSSKRRRLMGILSRLLGHASEADIGAVEETLQHALADDEKVEKAFQLVRDLIIFTNRRMILVDRQGMTGKKTDYHSVPYRAVSHFSVESAGHFDLEAELKIWISGTVDPIQKTFKRGQTIFEVQKALATYVGK
jgi:hypothetical protein